MKGKFLASFIAVVMVLTSVVVCFAGSSGIQPRYVSAKHIAADLSISGAKATAKTVIEPMSSNSLDSVIVTVSIINSGTKETIKTWDKTLSLSSANDFRYENSVTLTAKGKYYTKAVAKCYKGGKLIETLSAESKVQTY